MLRTASVRSLRLLLGSALLLLMLAGLAGLPSSAFAEPTVVRTTPLDGEILQRTPTAVGIGFDIPLDQEQSSFQLLHPDGTEVTNTSVTWSSDATSVTINLPKSFPDGVYTIVWNAVSASDGSATQGWSSFSVGNPEDANIITIPTSATGHQGPADWVQTGARFVALVGLAASLSIWPIWRGVIRPTLGRARAIAASTTRALQQWAWIALGIGIIGSLVELVVHSMAERDAGVIDAIMQALGHDEWGFWWIVRMALLVVLGIALAISPWWYPGRARFNDILLWTISLLIPLPLVVSGYAVHDEIGRVTTGMSQYLLYLSLSLLIGASIGLAIVLRLLHADTHKAAITALRTRFMWLVIVAGAIATLASFYLGSLFAGNLDALTETAFGNALMAQAILGIIAVVIAAFVLTRSFGTPASRTGATVLAVVMGLILIATSATDVLTPARTELVERSVQTREDVSFDGRPGIFLVAPGRAGVNHWRLETPGTYLQTETEVFVDISSPDFPQIGTKTLQMYRVQGNAFEHHGTEFSLMGEWQITIRIEEPGFPSSVATYSQHFGEENTSVNVPAAPWKLSTFSGLTGIALSIVAITGIATAAVAGKGSLRKEASGLAAVGVALACVVLLQGRVDPLLVVESGEGAINPDDIAMVTRGQDLYATYCLSCHGAGLRGDGPLAEALNPPPADFSQPHTKVHSDEDFIYWLQYGIQGTAMPGFRSQMSDQDIRDVIAFIYRWQQDDGASLDMATPEAAQLGVCEVTPVEFSDLPALFHHGLHPETRRGTPLVRAADSTVSPDQANDVMWTIEQAVNCANQDQFRAQIRLYTTPMLQDIFPQGASYEFTSRSTAPSEPVDPANAISIQDVQSMNYLADGRIAVTVIFNDPLGIGVIPGAGPVYQVTLIMVQEDGVWYIDEVR